MKKEFSSIVELKAIREQKKQLTERENELVSPDLKDLELIPRLYEWFTDMEKLPCTKTDCVTQRKKFLFVVLFLYAPSVLAGGRLPNGIRNKLSEIFKDVSPCMISNNIADITFIFQRYKGFRKDIEYLYNRIIDRLEVEGLIK